MADLPTRSTAPGFQAENAEHEAAEDPPAAAPADCFQAEEGEHSPEEPGAAVS